MESRCPGFKYIKNFMIDRPYTQPTYMDVNGVEFVKTMRTLKEQGKLNSVQERFLSDFRPSEELYDIVNDPGEMVNLINDPKYTSALKNCRAQLFSWAKEYKDPFIKYLVN